MSRQGGLLPDPSWLTLVRRGQQAMGTVRGGRATGSGDVHVRLESCGIRRTRCVVHPTTRSALSEPAARPPAGPAAGRGAAPSARPARAPALSPASWSAAGPSPAHDGRGPSMSVLGRRSPGSATTAADARRAPSTRTAPPARRGEVIVGHLRQYGGRRAAKDGEAVPDELGSRHPRQDALDKRAVGPRRVQRSEIGEPAGIYVHAAQVESLSGPLVQLPVQAGQDLLPCRTDRALRQSNQVEVTDTRDVVSGSQGTGHEQIGTQPRSSSRSAR